jgi:hypothetical protein
MMRRIAIASVLLAAGCAGQQAAQKQPQGPTTTEERMRITNQFPFDVGVCQTQPRTLPQPLNQNILLGAMFSAQPEVLECLTSPTSRGDAKATRVAVTATVNDQGGTHAVSGENLSPEGQACVRKALELRVPLTALPTGAKPVEYQTEFNHQQDNNASVKLGLNPGSDFSGAVRLGQPTWCDCYAGFANKVPPTLKATVELKKGLANAAAITFEPVNNPEGDALAACLQGKMMAIPTKLDVDQLKFVYRFIHLNSRSTDAASAQALAPELRFFQLDLERGQRSADAAIAIGGRESAAAAYDAAVVKFQKTDRKKQQALLPELTSKCNALVAAAQQMVDAMSVQLQVDQRSLALIQELKAQDASFGEAETRLQEAITASQQDLENAQKRVKADQAICPKVNY